MREGAENGLVWGWGVGFGVGVRCVVWGWGGEGWCWRFGRCGGVCAPCTSYLTCDAMNSAAISSAFPPISPIITMPAVASVASVENDDQ